ncbi:MAG: PEGA domain-containing protein [bacterium]|nr:PEGA domain-containing protein [bacterium]
MSDSRLVDWLRLISRACWLVLALALFHAPLVRVLDPVTRALGLPGLSRPAGGFMIEITSVPAGGRVFVDGVDRGTAPMFANVACSEGQWVTITVVKEGVPPWERVVGCREGKRLLVQARLNR